jgi:RNA polymerase sigma-70 factor (ECF subfamily)
MLSFSVFLGFREEDNAWTKDGKPMGTKRNPRKRNGDTSEKGLIDSLKQGDQEALRAVIRRHHFKLYFHVDSICKNSADTEEVLQNTYITVWAKINRFEERASLFTWIYRIATNGALLKRRKEERWRKTVSMIEQRACDGDAEGAPPSHERHATTPEETLLKRELHEQIRHSAAVLPEIYREVFDLRDVRGLSIDETCKKLNLTPNTAKSRLRRSRLKIRKNLELYVKTA